MKWRCNRILRLEELLNRPFGFFRYLAEGRFWQTDHFFRLTVGACITYLALILLDKNACASVVTMQRSKASLKIVFVGLAILSLVACEPNQSKSPSGSESLRAATAFQDAGRTVALKFGVSKLSRPQVAARARATHASAVVWVASGGGQRCFYLEVVVTGSGPLGTSSCSTDSATACSVARLSGFMVGIVPTSWNGELTMSTGGATIETVAVNNGYFLNSETSRLPPVPLILSSTSGGKKSESCMATLS